MKNGIWLVSFCPVILLEVLKLFFLDLSLVAAGKGNGNPLQYSCLENPMDGGACSATVHGVAKSRTQLSDFCFFLSFSSCGEQGYSLLRFSGFSL